MATRGVIRVRADSPSTCKIVVSANAAGRDMRSVVEDIRKRVDASVELPEGYHIEYGGQFESEEAASRTLLLTSLFTVVAIFLLLYMQFGRNPAMIISSFIFFTVF